MNYFEEWRSESFVSQRKTSPSKTSSNSGSDRDFWDRLYDEVEKNENDTIGFKEFKNTMSSLLVSTKEGS